MTIVHDSIENQPGLAQRIVFGRNPRWTLLRVILWIVILGLGSQFVVRPVRVQGISMAPTYKEGQVNLIFRWAYSFREPARGDVVAIRYAGEHIMLLKRIIALPGETIGFLDGTAVVDGKPLAEPYVKLPCTWTRKPVTLGPNEYFVVGDNRSMPQENHDFGRALRNRVVGRALL